jgi:HPt (histidine-containing phosphotransfer) domain-containing protein
MERITVEIDDEIKDLIPGFLARKRGELQRIAAALAAGDFTAVAAIAHRFKGEGAAYGFDEMSEMGKELERAAKAGNAADAQRIAAQIGEYIDAVAVV